jgi:DNA polymerase-3 subunit epsilon
MDHEELARTLDETGDYRVLRRLNLRPHVNAPDGTETKLAIMLDLETTGLNEILPNRWTVSRMI